MARDGGVPDITTPRAPPSKFHGSSDAPPGRIGDSLRGIGPPPATLPVVPAIWEPEYDVSVPQAVAGRLSPNMLSSTNRPSRLAVASASMGRSSGTSRP